MELENLRGIAMLGIVALTLLGAIFGVNRRKMTVRDGFTAAVVSILVGLGIHFLGVVTDRDARGGVVAFLCFAQESVSYGSAIVAVGYGLLLFSVGRALFDNQDVDDESEEEEAGQ
jgi:hypothetical protein